nr:Gfo/Idh/MocA family oxidoreductase [Actinomyces sp. 186855]
MQNRYNVSSVELKRLLASGALGTVRGAYATVAWSRSEGYYPSKPWRGQWARSGGGLLMNQAPHTLDLIQWLLGDVVGVQGHVSTDKFAGVSEVEDTAYARFTHADGTTTCFYGTVNLSTHRPVEIELDCEKAYVTLRDGLEVRWADGRTERHEERRAASSGRSYWGVSHELLIRDFYNRLDEAEPFWISPREATRCLAMAKAVYRASAGTPAPTATPISV